MLRDGGVDLYTLTERDPIAETALQYAAIVKTGFDDQGGHVKRHIRLDSMSIKSIT